MSKIKAHRHGEILFVETKEIPTTEAKLSKTNILMKGSGNNPHSFKGGKFFEFIKTPYIFGYFEAKDTILTHPEHGDKKVGKLLQANLPNGKYELRKGQEFVNSEIRPIVD